MFSSSTTFAADMSSKTTTLSSSSEPVTLTHQSSSKVVADDVRIKPIQESIGKAVSGEKVKIIPIDGIQIDKPTNISGDAATSNATDANALAALSDIIAYDLKPAAGQSSPFTALADTNLEVTIANIGGASTGNFTLGIKIDDILMGSTTVNSLAPNTGTIYTLILQDVPEGYHTVQVIGDYYNVVAESNEDNNTVSATYLWVGTPNLKAESLSADSIPPFGVGKGIGFTFRISNNGNGSINGDCPVELRVNGDVIATWTVTNWPAQKYLEDSFTLTFNAPGTYTVEMRADPYNAIAESNEYDNNISNTYQVVILPDSYEPNDTVGTATSVSRNSTIYANIHTSTDVDYYKFNLETGYDLTITLSNIPSGNDYDLELRNASSIIGSSTRGGNSDENINLPLSSGTYYIRVYSYSGYSGNNYTLGISSILPSLPTSGSEVPYAPSLWNYDPVQYGTNCYAYSLNNQVYPSTNELSFLQPGELAGYGYLPPSAFTESDHGNTIIQRCLADANAAGFIFTPTTRNAKVPGGQYKVTLVIDPDYPDYHWYRQNPDGTWSHKPGGTAVRKTDGSGAAGSYIIYDPQVANRVNGGLNYRMFIGYFSVTPLNNMYNPNQKLNMAGKAPIKDNLSMIDIESLKLGMSLAEVEKLLGSAHEYIGSGILRHVYHLNDGTSIQLTYARENINSEEKLIEITSIGKDGKKEILSKQNYETGVPSEQSKALNLSKQDFAFLHKGMEYSKVYEHVGLGKYKTYGDIISYTLKDGSNIELVFSASGLDYVQISDYNGDILQKLSWDLSSNKILLDSNELTK